MGFFIVLMLLYVLVAVIAVSYFCVAQITEILQKNYKSTWKRIGSPGLVWRGRISAYKFQRMLMFDKRNIPKNRQIETRRNVIRACGFLDMILFALVILNFLAL